MLYLDADSFPVANPEYLFESAQYQETGAIFWPDIAGQVLAKREIWDAMGIPFREEPEFESGQMLVDTVRHKEPLELALKMNEEAEKYYHLIWGDKDTFRFAWHKFGRAFSMTPYPLQLLSLPGMPVGSPGVMCQHDFDGERLFQHRNLAKWDLLGENPRIPGYVDEAESRQFLAELRALWNGRLNWQAAKRGDYRVEEWKERGALVKELTGGKWLMDDRRVRSAGCCGPVEKWSDKPVSKPWMMAPKFEDVKEVAKDELKDDGAGRPASLVDPTFGYSRGLRMRELAMAEDSTLSLGASTEAYWWDLELEKGVWVLYLLNDKQRTARMTRTADGGWKGKWLLKGGGVVGLVRVERRFLSFGSNILWGAGRPASLRALHVANHAHGIGDAITGLYAAIALTANNQPVVYHTRFGRWMQRAFHPLLTITGSPPPKGTRDMDVDYAEQLRYAPDKVSWYAGRVAGDRGSVFDLETNKLRQTRAVRPTVQREVKISRLGFSKYVLLAPFAAWEARDWPEQHWRRLAHLLKEQGYEIVAIGTKAEAARLERTFNNSNAFWVVDHEPEWVMDAMLEATAVIALDSGMIHVAGLLGVPAVCIHAHLPGEFLFSHAPTVRSVTPNTGCVGCRWQEDRGFTQGCATACSALAVVGPEAVMESVSELLLELPRRKRGLRRHDAKTEFKSSVVAAKPLTAKALGPMLIPRNLWFTNETRELHPNADQCLSSWHQMNPGWRMSLIDDNACNEFVQREYGGEIWDTFQSVPIGVMKADFWRVLVVYKYGGIYADTDTTCLQQIETWVGSNDGLVLGLENEDHFNNWTIGAVPGHPVLKAVIDLILLRARGGVEADGKAHGALSHGTRGVYGWNPSLLRQDAQ